MTWFNRPQLLLFLLGGLLLLGAWALPTKMVDDPLAVAVGLWPGAETLVVARERGLLDPRRVRLIELTWDSAAMRALESGAIDAAVLSLDEVIRLRETGHDVKVMLVFDESVDGDAVVVGSGANSIAELRDRRVGVDMRGPGMVLLAALVESSGMALADIQLVPLRPAEMQAALENGNVDAVVCAHPWLSSLSGRRLARPGVGHRLFRCLVVAGGPATKRREVLRELVAAHFAVQADVRDCRPLEGMQTVLRRERTTPEAFSASSRSLHWLSLEENQALLGGRVPGLQAVAAEVCGLMVRHRMVRDYRLTDEWMDASVLPRP